jgi:hypothetical protein
VEQSPSVLPANSIGPYCPERKVSFCRGTDGRSSYLPEADARTAVMGGQRAADLEQLCGLCEDRMILGLCPGLVLGGANEAASIRTPGHLGVFPSRPVFVPTYMCGCVTDWVCLGYFSGLSRSEDSGGARSIHDTSSSTVTACLAVSIVRSLLQGVEGRRKPTEFRWTPRDLH